MISIVEIFKTGVGPSSSHTMGPMLAGALFVRELADRQLDNLVTHVGVDIHGSLSLTGKGHHTDIAVLAGLAGNKPATVDVDILPAFIQQVQATRRLSLGGSGGRTVSVTLNFCRTQLPCTRTACG